MTNLSHKSKIAVIGIGGAGVSIVNDIIMTGVEVDCLTIDTDQQKLRSSLVATFLLGEEEFQGLGSRLDPSKVEQVALENKEQLQALIQKYEMIYLIAGMSGSTGGGASVVVARAARDLNIRTIAICLTPFNFEGRRRRTISSERFTKLLEETDICIRVPQQQLIAKTSEQQTILDLFRKINRIIAQSISGLLRIQEQNWEEVQLAVQNQGIGFLGFITVSENEGLQKAIRQVLLEPSLENVSLSNTELAFVAVTTSQQATKQHVEDLVLPQCSAKTKLFSDVLRIEQIFNKIQVVLVVTGCKKQVTQVQPMEIQPPSVSTMAGGSPHHGKGGSFPEESLIKLVENAADDTNDIDSDEE